MIVSVVDINARAMHLAKLPSYTSRQIIEMTRNDSDTWNIFARGYTVGINQCEKQQTTNRLMQYMPRCLEDLAAFVAAIRPGFASNLKDFIARNKFSYNIPSFDALLKNDSTGSSWLLYQENIMNCLNLAGFTLEETYPIIKAISKKKREKIASAKDRFIPGFAKYISLSDNISEDAAKEAANAVWKIIEDSASYSFNASHAVAVALDALYGTYLKAHHPYEYYTALLEKVNKKGDKDRLARIRAEMKRAFGITMVPCRFGVDATHFTIDKDRKAIYDVLSSAKKLSLATANGLNRLAENFYFSFTDLLYAAQFEPSLNAAKLDRLIRLNYFSSFGGSQKLLLVMAAFNDGDICFKKTYVEKTQRTRLEKLNAYESEIPDTQLSDIETFREELDAYGTPLSIFPSLKGTMGVVSIIDSYGIKATLYNPTTGGTGLVRVKKSLYEKSPFHEHDILATKIEPRISHSGTRELWLTDYKLLNNC